jgi:hypothetical protein
MADIPAWGTGAIAGVAMLFGSFFKPMFGLIRSRESYLQDTIKRHESEIIALRLRLDVIQDERNRERREDAEKFNAEIRRIHEQKHEAQNAWNAMNMKYVLEQVRRNDLLRELNRPAEAIDTPQTVPGAT